MSTTAADGLKAAADATLTTKSSTGSDTSATEASDKETQENETEEVSESFWHGLWARICMSTVCGFDLFFVQL